MDVTILVTMGSVFLGFLLLLLSFAGFNYRWNRRLVWGLFVVSVIFITLVPLIIAVGFATQPA